MTSLFVPYFNSKSNLFDILQANLLENEVRQSYDPPTDIFEDEEKYSVLMQVPGFNKENIEVTVDQNILSIEGKYSEKLKDRKYILRESFERKFVRKFKLDSSKVDLDSVKSSLKNGELLIEIKKASKFNSKKITIE